MPLVIKQRLLGARIHTGWMVVVIFGAVLYDVTSTYR